LYRLGSKKKVKEKSYSPKKVGLMLKRGGSHLCQRVLQLVFRIAPKDFAKVTQPMEGI
jgi:hypothetical protein